MAIAYILQELLTEAESYRKKHPAIAVIAVIVVIRIVWLMIWWVFFAPAPLYPLTGRITCCGALIEEGNVAFEPVDGSSVASRTAHVKNGMFMLGKASGVVRDLDYVVRVEGFRKTGRTYPGINPGDFSEEYEQFVLPEFNRQSGMRVRMTQKLLTDGLQVDVQGTRATAPTKRSQSR